MGGESSNESAAVIVNAASLNTSGCSSTHGNDTRLWWDQKTSFTSDQ